jgi:opacity protein-like surface antigen
MKKVKLIAVVLIGTMTAAVSGVQAQNYKAPTIDQSGKITVDGKHIGSIKDNKITDHTGIAIASVDSEGMVVDSKTGKNLGKAEKNGDFVYSFPGEEEKYTFSEPDKDGYCAVKDKTGSVVGMVHQNYKQQGACAIHCLTKQKPEIKK